MKDSSMTLLKNALLEGDTKESLAQAKYLKESGVNPENIIKDGIESAMSELDAKCTLEQFNLLEIMLVGRAVMEVIKYLFPSGKPSSESEKTVVIATLEGDIHDLGKNILRMILICNGYNVIDCGKDCSLQKLGDVIKQNKPFAVGISGLITSIIPLVRKVKPLLEDLGMNNIKVFAGGAALKQASCEKLNVDYVAETAFDGVKYIATIKGVEQN